MDVSLVILFEQESSSFGLKELVRLDLNFLKLIITEREILPVRHSTANKTRDHGHLTLNLKQRNCQYQFQSH